MDASLADLEVERNVYEYFPVVKINARVLNRETACCNLKLFDSSNAGNI
jgi:hypothetical protein